jgi:polyferredoxin
MIVGMVVLGFMYNNPLTLSSINKFLMGFFPQWQTNLYWYILILGIILVFSVDNKNPYCEWFCPFGAAQECMGVIGGAKVRSPGKYRTFLKWLQRGLAWGAILIALLYRNPGITSFEIFGTLFDLVGSNFQFGLLGIVLIASLFIRRPWCTYLCPLHPVDEFIRMTRKWILGLWPKRRKAK